MIHAALPALICVLTASDTLGVDDPAPPLDIAHWLIGPEVRTFEPGKIYILEFWATWCGPCVANMGHLSEVQEKHADDGVVVIGTSDEPLPKVVRFLFSEHRGEGVLQNERIRYRLVTDPDRSVWEDYMVAAGRQGLPQAFIIGRDGRIEWIGHPHPSYMDEPLARIVAGTWDRAAFEARFEPLQQREAELSRLRESFSEASGAGDWEAALAALDGIIAGGGETSIPTKLAILLGRLEDRQRGYAYAQEILEQAWAGNDWLLMQVGWVASGGSERFPVGEAMRDYDLARSALVRANELTEWSDYGHLSMLAGIEFQMGRLEDAIHHQQMTLDRFAALAERISDHEREAYEQDRARYEETLARYRAAARAR